MGESCGEKIGEGCIGRLCGGNIEILRRGYFGISCEEPFEILLKGDISKLC